MRLLQLFESDTLNTVTVHWAAPRRCLNSIARGDEVVVWVDVAKIEESWQQERNFYIGPGGSHNAIGDRYARFDSWFRWSLENNTPVEMSELGLN